MLQRNNSSASTRKAQRESTPAAEIAVELRNAEIKRREAMLKEAKLERRRRKKRRASRATLRIAELSRLFFTRYRGNLLPDDDSGRDDAWIMINHLAMLNNPALRIKDWLWLHAPWLRDDPMIDHALAKRYRWRADTMAKMLNVTDAERTQLKLWTIGAVDLDKDQRQARRREKNRLAQEARRRTAGAQSRAQSLTAQKPWELEGKSRRTWYRQQMAQKRVQHIATPTVHEFVPSVPQVRVSGAGSASAYAEAVGRSPLRVSSSAVCTAGAAVSGVASRPATTLGCTRPRGIPVATLAEAERVRAAIFEAARHEALAQRRVFLRG